MMSLFVDLKDLYSSDLHAELDAIKQIEAGNNVEGQLTGLWYNNRTFFLYELEHSDFQQAKLRAYTCGRIDEYLMTHYDSRILDYGVINITFAILSDDIPLINRYTCLSHSFYYHTIKKGSLTHAIQNIIKEDWTSLEGDIATYSRIVLTQRGKINIPDLTFFKGMLERNADQMKAGILMLLKDHKRRNKHMGIAQEYISVPALTYTKLAWLKGFELEIDHPLIPKALLPFDPLPHYDEHYDFLKA